MSWDVVFMRIPGNVESLGDIPKDFQPPALGKRDEIINCLINVLPGWDFSHEWGTYEGLNHSITLDLVDMGNPDIINSLYAHVRGGDSALITLRTIWLNINCSAFDGSTGERLDDSEDPGRGLRAWRGYRNSILRNAEDSMNGGG